MVIGQVRILWGYKVPDNGQIGKQKLARKIKKLPVTVTKYIHNDAVVSGFQAFNPCASWCY